MASPYEQTFLSSLTERKRKRSDIAQIARGRSPSLRQEDRYLFKTSITLPSAGRAIGVANLLGR